MRPIDAVPFEQNDEWQTSSRHMMVEALAQIDKEGIDPHSQHHHKGRPIMTSGHPANYTTLTDVTAGKGLDALKKRFSGLARPRCSRKVLPSYSIRNRPRR